jgi:hypothetical protein
MDDEYDRLSRRLIELNETLEALETERDAVLEQLADLHAQQGD